MYGGAVEIDYFFYFLRPSEETAKRTVLKFVDTCRDRRRRSSIRQKTESTGCDSIIDIDRKTREAVSATAVLSRPSPRIRRRPKLIFHRFHIPNTRRTATVRAYGRLRTNTTSYYKLLITHSVSCLIIQPRANTSRGTWETVLKRSRFSKRRRLERSPTNRVPSTPLPLSENDCGPAVRPRVRTEVVRADRLRVKAVVTGSVHPPPRVWGS